MAPGKRYEQRDSLGEIRRIDETTFQLSFPFANAVTAVIV
jgi:hypothetical protein